MPPRLALLVALVASVSACGGKILEEHAGGEGSAPSADPPVNDEHASSSEAEPSSSRVPSAGPAVCETLCERDARCPTTLPSVPNGGDSQSPGDCLARCTSVLAADACGAEAWMSCYAARVDGCSALPAECRAAYCAWSECAAETGSAYCR